MQKLLRWFGIGTGSLLSMGLIAAMGLYGYSHYKLNRTYSLDLSPLPIPTDAASIERGRHLATAVAKCIDCHGPALGGKVFVDEPALGRIVAANLTRGEGGIARRYEDEDWVRAIRHGVRPDGKAALFMPASEYSHLTDADLVAIIAYVKTVPAVDNDLPASTVGPLGRALYLAGQLPLTQADALDHYAARPASLAIAPNAEYGAYLANIGGCIGCHGPNLAGGNVPGTPPDDPAFPPATNLTPAGPMGSWSEREFVMAMRTGRRPDGSQMADFMPWRLIGQMSEDELLALYRYLQTVPPQPAGSDGKDK